VFCEKAGLCWRQEFPNQLLVSPLGEATRIIERGAPGLHPEAARASRLAIGHAEGMLGAFANLYRDLHAAILARRRGKPAPDLGGLPMAKDGVETVKTIHAAARSAQKHGAWVDV
jgi:predicted dehydrogenase